MQKKLKLKSLSKKSLEELAFFAGEDFDSKIIEITPNIVMQWTGNGSVLDFCLYYRKNPEVNNLVLLGNIRAGENKRLKNFLKEGLRRIENYEHFLNNVWRKKK